MKEIIENLLNASGLEAYDKASKVCTDYFLTANDAEKEILRKVLIQDANRILEASKETNKRADALIAKFSKKEVIIDVDGVKYPLKEWLTIKEYCDTFGLKTTSIVTNWSKRGIIPAENILYLPQLNIRLIKAVAYK